MATLYKQEKSKNWTMRFTDEHGRVVRKSTRTADKSAANMMLAQELRAVELRRLGIGAPSPLQAKTPINELVERHLHAELAAGLKPEWVELKRRRLGKVIGWTGIRTIRELTPDLIRSVLTEHLGDLKPGTRGQYLSTISQFCEWGIDHRPPLLASNPTIGIKPRLGRRAQRVEDHRQVRRCLWTSEIPMLLGARPSDPSQQLAWDNFRMPLYAVAMWTGFRRGTLKELTPSMVRLDVANPHIAVPPELLKSGRRLVMPLRDEQVIGHIETLLRGCSLRKPTYRGAPNRWQNRPFGPVPRSSKTFRGDLERADIPLVDEEGRMVVFHSLRATFATQLALAGVPAQVTMGLMDHADIKTTLKYYTMVGVDDNTRFMDQLPALDSMAGSAAVGMLQSMRVQSHTVA